MVTRSNPTFSPEHLRFLHYIKAVGTGPKGNRNLSYEEAYDSISLILGSKIPEPLISAFLLGWRVQGESESELQAYVDFLAQTIKERHHLPCNTAAVEIGYPLDGKAKFPPIMLKAAEYLKKIDIHAVYDLPLGPKYGITPECFSPLNHNVHLHSRSSLLPELSTLNDLRNSIGIRTAFNTIEKLSFLSPIGLIGMHHAPYFDLYATLYSKHYRRLFIIQGHEGTPEILKKTKFKIVENGEVSTHHLDPEEFGIEPINAKDEMDEEQMRLIWDHPDENLAKMIKLNAALIGFAAGLFQTIEEGFACLQD